MLNHMNNLDVSCVFYVKVGTFAVLEQSQTSLLTVKENGIVRLTVQYDLIVSVSFMYYPGNHFRPTSADVLSLNQCPLD